jgi:hypothetical protein
LQSCYEPGIATADVCVYVPYHPHTYTHTCPKPKNQASRPAVCFIEGVMGGGYAGLDLTKPTDREYLLGALASAVARGLFAG